MQTIISKKTHRQLFHPYLGVSGWHNIYSWYIVDAGLLAVSIILYPLQVKHLGWQKGSWRLSMNVCCVLCRYGALVSMVCINHWIFNIVNLARSIRLINGFGTEVVFAATSNPLPNHIVRTLHILAHCLGLVSFFYWKWWGTFLWKAFTCCISWGAMYKWWQCIIPTLV